VDAENTLSREGDYDVVNLDLRYDFKAVTLGFHIRNLFDEEYNGFVWRQTWGTPETWFSPGDERSYYASVMFEF